MKSRLLLKNKPKISKNLCRFECCYNSKAKAQKPAKKAHKTFKSPEKPRRDNCNFKLKQNIHPIVTVFF